MNETLNDKCWICGSEANSEEHKFKSSDLRRHYGKKYTNTNMSYVQGDKISAIDSYKSKELKFTKVIYVDCNNNKTKPHDNAYDKFAKYILSNYEKLLKEKQINFVDIYQNDWKEEKANLYRYYAKHAGCKIVTGDYPYELQNLADFILGTTPSQTLCLHFQLKEGIKTLIDLLNGYAHLFNGHTVYFKTNESDKHLSYGGWCSYQWITVNWVVSPYIAQNKQPSFNESLEPLSIKYLKEYDEFSTHRNTKDILESMEYAGLKDLETRAQFFEDIIK